jgi:calcineurin-like phosphoesterase family protein
LSHYPTITSNVDEAYLSQHLFNLYGHTHQKTKFYNDIPWIYNVGVDSHNCTPVDIDQIIEDCRIKYKECGDML